MWVGWWPTGYTPLALAQTNPKFDPADWIQLGGTAAALAIAFAWVQSERSARRTAETALMAVHEDRHREDQILLARHLNVARQTAATC